MLTFKSILTRPCINHKSYHYKMNYHFKSHLFLECVSISLGMIYTMKNVYLSAYILF